MLHAYHKCCTNGTCNVFLWQSFRNHPIIWIKKVKPVLLKKIYIYIPGMYVSNLICPYIPHDNILPAPCPSTPSCQMRQAPSDINMCRLQRSCRQTSSQTWVVASCRSVGDWQSGNASQGHANTPPNHESVS